MAIATRVAVTTTAFSVSRGPVGRSCATRRAAKPGMAHRAVNARIELRDGQRRAQRNMSRDSSMKIESTGCAAPERDEHGRAHSGSRDMTRGHSYTRSSWSPRITTSGEPTTAKVPRWRGAILVANRATTGSATGGSRAAPLVPRGRVRRAARTRPFRARCRETPSVRRARARRRPAQAPRDADALPLAAGEFISAAREICGGAGSFGGLLPPPRDPQPIHRPRRFRTRSGRARRNRGHRGERRALPVAGRSRCGARRHGARTIRSLFHPPRWTRVQDGSGRGAREPMCSFHSRWGPRWPSLRHVARRGSRR